MLVLKISFVWILSSFLHLWCRAFEPISLTVAAVSLGLGWWKRDMLVDNTVCKLNECCRKTHIKSDIGELKRLLETHLYGQHIAQDVLVNAVGAHLDNIHMSRKPLVMSFHGTAGTGKNYVADFVARALYKNSIDSNFVYKSSPNVSPKELFDKIKETVKKCPRSLFIFDEIEKMQAGVFDDIVSLLDHHSAIKGYDFKQAIFIFLTNSAGAQIAKKLKSLEDSGRWRDDTQLQEFERIAEIGAYNVLGGLYRSRLIDSHVIDHFVPFLPLEIRHVEKCVIQEFKKFCIRSPTEGDIKYIIDEAVTLDDTGSFSNNGCKRITKKVQTYCFANNNSR